MAPEFAFDTARRSQGGVTLSMKLTRMFSAARERFATNWSAVRRMCPYNAYEFYFECGSGGTDARIAMRPDVSAGELHRVWVVEATLKSATSRHVYAKLPN